MPLLTVLALMALPFLEVWLMIVVGGSIGALWTVAALISLMVLGVAVLRHSGRAFRGVLQEADEAMRAGEQPRKGVLDPLMLMAGGVLLIVPGFLTAALGILLVTPFTRPLLRWAFIGWAERRMRKMRDRMEEELLNQGVRIPNQGPGGQGSGGQGGGPFGPQGDPSGQRPGPDEERSGRGRVIQGSFEPTDDDKD